MRKFQVTIRRVEMRRGVLEAEDAYQAVEKAERILEGVSEYAFPDEVTDAMEVTQGWDVQPGAAPTEAAVSMIEQV